MRRRRRRAGRIDGVPAAFLVLGCAAFLVHQMLDGTEACGAEVALAARQVPVLPGDGWLGLDDESEADWEAMLFSRWPVLSDDFVRGPPEIPAGRRESA